MKIYEKIVDLNNYWLVCKIDKKYSVVIYFSHGCKDSLNGDVSFFNCIGNFKNKTYQLIG